MISVLIQQLRTAQQEQHYSKYMHLSERDKSSKGQEFHKHPRKWSIEETVNNSSPGQLEYFIKSP